MKEYEGLIVPEAAGRNGTVSERQLVDCISADCDGKDCGRCIYRYKHLEQYKRMRKEQG